MGVFEDAWSMELLFWAVLLLVGLPAMIYWVARAASRLFTRSDRSP